MKMFIPQITWEGGFGKYFVDSMKANDVEVITNTNRFHRNPLLRITGLRKVDSIRKTEWRYFSKKYGEQLLSQCVQAKPDVFFVFNESKLSPFIIKKVKEKCKCMMVLALGDDPWDSIRWRSDFPHSLKYFDLIFSPEPSWNNNIRKVAPNAKIFWHFGGYDEQQFAKVSSEDCSKSDYSKLSCEIAFTGSSYAEKAEGAYRSDILSYLTKYDLKIWGGDNWEYRFKFNPELKKAYQGGKLTFEELRKLYFLSDIFINLPAPQICFGFQPRVFEIAGCGGFQIADSRLLLKYLFSEDELITFDTIQELKDKIDYYLNNKNERDIKAEKLHQLVKKKYTWRNWANRILKAIEQNEGIQDLDLKIIKADNEELRELIRNA